MNRGRLRGIAFCVTPICILFSAAPAAALDGNLDYTVSPLPPEYSIDADGAVKVRICFNWSCSRTERVTFTAEEMSALTHMMALCPADTLDERVQRVRMGILQMERLAQNYLPVLGNDREINDYDADKEGRTDCVDNASNTTTFLHVLQEYSQLPGWSVSAPGVRDLLDIQRVHWTAVLVDDASGLHWSVDSWFRPHGHLPFVMPLSDWLEDKKGWEPPFDKLNPYPRFVNELCGRR